MPGVGSKPLIQISTSGSSQRMAATRPEPRGYDVRPEPQSRRDAGQACSVRRPRRGDDDLWTDHVSDNWTLATRAVGARRSIQAATAGSFSAETRHSANARPDEAHGGCRERVSRRSRRAARAARLCVPVAHLARGSERLRGLGLTGRCRRGRPPIRSRPTSSSTPKCSTRMPRLGAPPPARRWQHQRSPPPLTAGGRSSRQETAPRPRRVLRRRPGREGRRENPRPDL
jgi:hypothetical protein